MTTAIFIRSYAEDFQWLEYCVRSIRKFCRGFSEIIVAIPVGDEPSLPAVVRQIANRIVTVQEGTRGYIAQQITKLQAARYTNAEAILFVDSDCIFRMACTPDDFFVDGKPLLLRASYDSFRGMPQNRGVLNWRRVTRKALGFPVDYEYMRRVPIVFLRSTLVDLDAAYPGMEQYCLAVKGHHFSEFNVLGAFAAHSHPDRYTILDDAEFPKSEFCAKQYWSWGGIESSMDEIRQTIGIECLTHRNDLGEHLNSKGLLDFGCEIGTAYGEHAERILQMWKGATLFCVDPWKKWDDAEYVDPTGKCDTDAMFLHALARLQKYPGRVSFIRQTSDDAVSKFPDRFFDFVYIDGNHHDPQISRDLRQWWPKVKLGGVFCGHDYYDLSTDKYRCEVKSAVDLFVADNKLTLHVTESDTSWWIEV